MVRVKRMHDVSNMFVKSYPIQGLEVPESLRNQLDSECDDLVEHQLESPENMDISRGIRFNSRSKDDYSVAVFRPNQSAEANEDVGRDFVQEFGPDDQTLENTVKDGGRLIRLRGPHVVKNIIKSNEPVDTFMFLEDGALGVHRMILAACSPFLGSILLDKDYEQDEFTSICLPEVKSSTMEIVLRLAYTGKMFFTEDEREDVFALMRNLSFGESGDLTIHPVTRFHVQKKAADCLKEIEEVESKLGIDATSVRGALLSDANGVRLETNSYDSETEPLPSTSRAANQRNRNKSNRSDQGSVKDDDTDKEALYKRRTPFEKSKAIKFIGGGDVECGICHKTVGLREAKTHLETRHDYNALKASQLEMEKLTFCTVCYCQYKTYEKARICLNSHGLVRCWICLEPIKKRYYKSHYQEYHTIVDKYGTIEDFIVPCRWCPQVTNISTNMNMMNAHCIKHLTVPNPVKKSQARSERGSSSISSDSNAIKRPKVPKGEIEIAIRADLKKKKMKFEKEGRSAFIANNVPKFEEDPVTGCIMVNLKDLPLLTVDIQELSPDVLLKAQAKKANQEKEIDIMDDEVQEPPRKLLRLDECSETMDEDSEVKSPEGPPSGFSSNSSNKENDEMEISPPISPEHLILETSKTVKSKEKNLAEADGKGTSSRGPQLSEVEIGSSLRAQADRVIRERESQEMKDSKKPKRLKQLKLAFGKSPPST